MKQIFDRKLLPAKPSRQTIVGLLNAYSPRAFSNILGRLGRRGRHISDDCTWNFGGPAYRTVGRLKMFDMIKGSMAFAPAKDRNKLN